MTTVAKDFFTWQAVYHDGTVINEFDTPESFGRGFAEVDQGKVKRLFLEPTHQFYEGHAIQIPAGAEPVFFRRRRILAIQGDDEGGQEATTHCIGWKKDGQAVYLFVAEDGSTILTEDFQAV